MEVPKNKLGGAESCSACPNFFKLFAHGDDFDPDAYMASAPLKFDEVWRKGDSGQDHPRTSGVFKLLGDGRTVPLLEQQRIAIEYLSTNREALKALGKHHGVTTFSLGLQYHIVLQASTSGFAIVPSALLMSHCLDIGILPAFYVTLDRESEWVCELDAEPRAAPDSADM